MTDDAQFLAAIRAAPTDLFLRLVYADWLDDQGDPRAAYLRLDVDLQKRIAVAKPMMLGLDEQVPKLLRAIAKLGRRLDPAWVALFDTLRPAVAKCRGCRKLLAPADTIDTHPRSFKKLKTTRYCKVCYEDAVRAGFDNRNSFESYSSSRRREDD